MQRLFGGMRKTTEKLEKLVPRTSSEPDTLGILVRSDTACIKFNVEFRVERNRSSAAVEGNERDRDRQTDRHRQDCFLIISYG